MPLDYLSGFVSVVLAISLGAERLVTAVKTAFPWLAQEQKTSAQEVDLERDRARRLILQLLAFGSSWMAASLMVPGTWTWSALVAAVAIGNTGGPEMPVPLLGLLASGGSSFWNNILGLTKAAKDTKQVEKASTTLSYHAQATSAGTVAVDGGQAAKSPDGSPGSGDASAAKAAAAVRDMSGRTQPAISGASTPTGGDGAR